MESVAWDLGSPTLVKLARISRSLVLYSCFFKEAPGL